MDDRASGSVLLAPGDVVEVARRRGGHELRVHGAVVGSLSGIGGRRIHLRTPEGEWSASIRRRQLVVESADGTERARIARPALRSTGEGTLDGRPVRWRRVSLRGRATLEADSGTLVDLRERGVIRPRALLTIGEAAEEPWLAAALTGALWARDAHEAARAAVA